MAGGDGGDGGGGIGGCAGCCVSGRSGGGGGGGTINPSSVSSGSDKKFTFCRLGCRESAVRNVSSLISSRILSACASLSAATQQRA